MEGREETRYSTTALLRVGSRAGEEGKRGHHGVLLLFRGGERREWPWTQLSKWVALPLLVAGLGTGLGAHHCTLSPGELPYTPVGQHADGRHNIKSA